ncbi:MAG: NAD(P)/FAD-dependent oxidoreductase [Rhodospirillaceae bacterium]|nr:NAD(P)/FAD-dependent oxidoreductase [Rhodospirillaceae bacterium]
MRTETVAAPPSTAPAHRAPTGAGRARPQAKTRPQVVIIGAGFGGLAAAHALRKAPVDVTVIDKRNYHLFQPLLYQVATAGLSPAQIASPIRGILSRQRNAAVLMAKVTAVDKAAKVVVAGDQRVPYDYLIVATGARHAYFGHDEWEPFAPGLKKIDDATDIRRRVLLAFEQAETATDQVERDRLLTFVVIGGGPTGVEVAGAVAELANNALARDFRNIDPRDARIILVEAGPRILPPFPESLSAAAERALVRLGAEVKAGTPVTAVTADHVMVGDERIETRTVIWAAGVAASPAARWLGADKDRAGRVIVGADLTLPGHAEIFVVGDTAAMLDPAGKPVPGIAPAAKQAGAYAAGAIKARIAGKPAVGPFRYRHAGNLATIGRKAAVVDFGWLRLRGNPAWWLWGAAHVFFLIGFRNRLTVMMDWFWSYLTFQRGSRLITGAGPDD